MEDKPKPKIEIAESTVVDALEGYVDVLLEALAEATGMSGIRCAMVTDLSSVADFLDGEPTGEMRMSKHPLTRVEEEVEVCTWDTDTNKAIVDKVSQQIGVPVEIRDYVYDVALRLKKKDEND